MNAVPDGAEAVGIGFALRAASSFGLAEPAGPFPLLITLGGEGGAIVGGEAGLGAGWSVASAGDVNGDGYADVAIGAPAADGSAGRAYVLFGAAAGIGAVDLAQLTAAQGFAIAGAAAGDEAGWSVAGAGDFNKDGFADVAIGVRKSDAAGHDSGEIYLIFGHGDPFSSIDLGAVTAGEGLRILGADADDLAGFSVAAAGDVNGDGFADLIVGAPHAGGANEGAGAAYLIFGRADAGPTLDLAALTADQGFVLLGSGAYAYAGSSVASAGDVNGDGFDDLIVGVPRGASGGAVAGEAYVVFGHAGPFGAADLAGLAPDEGFVLSGVSAYDYAGSSVASAGDVNGDGFADLIVGARYADADYAEGDTIGKAYVVFGHAGPFAAVELGALTPAQGFEIRGQAGFVQAGLSVASAGDINGDGFADLLVGAPYAGEGHRGRAYLIFGRNEGFGTIVLDALTPDQGFIVEGPSAGSLAGWNVAAAGDVDGDGYADLIVGAPGIAGTASDAGAAYILYGHATEAPPPGPPAVDLNGADAGAGFAVSFAEGAAGAALGQDIAVTAPGGPVTAATITITDAASGDALSLAGGLPAAIAVQSGLGTGQLVLAGTGSQGDWAAALALVRYSNAGDNPDSHGTHATRMIDVVVSDGLATSVPATAIVTIAAVNDAPVANDDSNGASEDGALVTGSVAGNDSDVDGAIRTYALDAPAPDGLTFRPDGSYSFDPSHAAYQHLAAGVTQLVAVTYTATDDQGATGTATLTIIVTGVNDAPDAADDSGATREDEALVFDPSSLTANDGDDDGDVLSVTAVGNAAGGAAVLGADGRVTFTPAANFSGVASFDYSVSDGHGSAGIATVIVTVAAVNDAPGGSDKSVSLLEDQSYAFTAQDFGFTDPVEGHALAAVLVAALPAAGMLTLNGQAVAAGQAIAAADLAGLVFTPAPNGNGEAYASLAFQVRDDGGTANGGQDTDPVPNFVRFDVTPVDDAPVITGVMTGDVVEPGGADDEDPGTPSASGNLDFSDVDNLADVWQAVTAGADSLFGFGSYGVTAAGDWTYVLKKTHAAVQALDGGATLTDMFTMLTADGIGQIVTVTIHGQNDAPVNSVPGAQTLAEDGSRIFSGANGNAIEVADVDAAGLTLILSVAHGALTLAGTDGLTFLDGANGSATMTVSGTAAAINAALDGLAYAPAADYYGADSLQVSTSDGSLTDTDDIGLAIEAVNDAPTVSIGDGSGAAFAGDTFLIGTGPAQAFPSGEVTALGNGGFAIVWTSNGLAGPYHAQSYDAAGAPAGPQAEIKGYVVVALEGGGFIALWRPFGSDGDGRGILAQRYDAGWNEVGAEFVVNSVTAGAQDNPAAAALEGGGFVVTWTSSDGSGDGIFAQRYDETGNRAGGQFRVNTATANSQGIPKVEALPGGGFVVIWITGQSIANGGPDVFGQRYDAAGIAVGAEFRVNTLTAGIQFNPAVAVLEDGGFVVVWEGLAPDGAGGISGRRYDAAGNALGTEFRISAPNDLFQQVPDVTALAGGGFVVTWDTNGPGDGDNIFALSFDSAGRPVGTEFRVDTVAESVSGPSIAGLAGGGFAIAWTSNGATVHGRRMEPVFHAVEQMALDLKGEILLGDVDAGTGMISVTLTVASGILHVTSGTSGASVSGDGSASVTITGTLAEVSALLGADAVSVVSFTADSDAPPASTSLSVTIDDNGNTGAGGALTASATRTIAIGAVNDAPVLTVTPRVGGETRVNSATAGDQSGPHLAKLADGGYVVSWTSSGQDGGGTGVYAQRYDAGGVAQGGEIRVNTTIANDQYAGGVAGLAGGGYVVVWQSFGQDGSGFGIYAQRYNADGAVRGGETHVSTSTSGDQFNPQVAALSGGSYVVAFSSGGDGEGFGVYTQRYTANGLEVGGQILVNSTTAKDQSIDAITALSGGGYLVVWTSYGGQDAPDTHSGVYAQRYDATGDRVGGETLINTTTAGSQMNAAAAALVGGGYVIVWDSIGQDGDVDGVYAQRFDANGVRLGGEVRVNGFTASSQSQASVAALSDGGYLVTWQSFGQDGSESGVYGQRYDSAGLAVGGEFRINATTADYQHQPSVLGLAGGDYLVAWAARGQDGSGFGIYTQRYESGFEAIEQVGLDLKGSITIADVDAGSAVVTVTLSVGFGILNVDAGTSGASVDWSGTSVTLMGTLAQLNALLHTDPASRVLFLQNSDTPPASTTLTVAVDGDAAVTEIGIAIAPVNDAPSGTDAARTIGEDGSYSFAAADFGFGDVDGHQFAGIFVTALPAQGALRLNGSFVTAGQTIGAADIANGLLVFTPAADAFGTNYALFGFQVQDDGGDAHGGSFRDPTSNTIRIDVTPVNDAPVVDLNGAGAGFNTVTTYTENGPAILVAPDAIVTDGDSANFDGGLFDVRMVNPRAPDRIDILNQGNGPGQIGASGSVISYEGVQIGTRRFDLLFNNLQIAIDLNANATPAALQALARAVTYSSATEDPWPVSRGISFSLTDGDGGTSAIRAATVNIVVINDAPDGSGAALGIGEGDVHVFAAGDFGFSDVDSNQLAAVRIVSLPAHGQLLLAGVAVAAGDSISAADLQAGKFTYAAGPFAAHVVTFDFQVRDDGGTANGGVDLDPTPGTLTINVAPDNFPPVVDLNGEGSGIDAAISYVDGAGPVAIGTGIAVSDSNEATGDQIVSATITLTDAVAGDSLTLSGPVPAWLAAVTTTTPPGRIVLTLSGAASQDAYAELIAQVRYASSNQNPTFDGTDPQRTINVVLSDGEASSAVAIATVTIVAVDDPGVPLDDAFAILESGTIANGNLLANDADPDGPALAIALVNGVAADVGRQIVLPSGALLTVNADGTFSFDTNGAFLWVPGPDSGAHSSSGQQLFTYTLAGGGTGMVTITLAGLDSEGDSVTGTAGNDRLDGGFGADILAGGLGDDSYFVDNAGDSVIEFFDEGYDIVYASVSYALAAGSAVELLGTIDNTATTPLNLFGNELANYVTGNAGANLIDGGIGPDQLWGRGGDDSYYADAGDDIVEYAGDGYDIVYARTSYGLGGGMAIEVLATIDNNATTAINLIGNAFDNYITGNAGANTLDGGGGSDQLWGREGDDSYIADMNDLVLEYAGQGSDILYATASYILANGLSIETLATVDNNATTSINLTGNELDNYVTGNAGANTLDGGAGSDTLWGRAGDDSYFADSNDVVLEDAGQGFDIIYARTSFVLGVGVSVELLGTVNNNAATALNLTGNELANYVTGNAGANILDGGAGADQLYGRGGADMFAFTTTLGGGNVDAILDFVSGTDRIALDDAIFAGIGTPGSFNPNAFFAGAAAHDSDDRIVYDQASGQLFYDADGSGAGAAMLFAVVSGAPAIAASDFTVI